MDVRDRASIVRAVAEIDAAWGGLDVLVNNAGIGMRTVNPSFLSEPQPFWQVSEEGFMAVIDTNLTGVFNACHVAIPYLRRRGGWVLRGADGLPLDQLEASGVGK